VPTAKRERQKEARRRKLEEQRRNARRQKNLRRGIFGVLAIVVIVGAVAVIAANTGGTTSTTSSTSTSTTSTSTTSTTTTTLPKNDATAQTDANNIAVAYGCPTSVHKRVNTLQWTKSPAMSISKSGTYYATFDTTLGTFVIKLDPAKAPVNVNNFVFLAQHNYYKCVIFHRVIQDFMDQSGDPTGLGSGSPGYVVPKNEFPSNSSINNYPPGTLAMANSNSSDPSATSNGGQFFVMADHESFELPANYTVIGHIYSGQSVVDAINHYGSLSSSETGTPTVYERILNVTISSNP
jgi:peptidyl-prolyl cis-trans isomerase B (cyclophilin B)